MTEVDIATWVDDTVHKIQCGEFSDDFDILTELTLKCFEGSFEVLHIPGTKEEVQAAIDADFKLLEPAVKRFDELWDKTIVHINDWYQVDIPRYYHFGVVIYLCGLTPNPVEKAFGRCAKHYMDHYIKDEPKAKIIESGEWCQAFSEFFNAFKDLGTYYNDPSRYETEEERKKHKELTDMFFNKIMPN